LSNLLWAACGINRPESGKRTAPTAMNDQEIDIYVCLKSGTYVYDAKNNVLKAICEGDKRSDMGKQNFLGDASVVLAYVVDYSKMSLVLSKADKEFYSATDVGYISQNVYLYSASENLATVVLGWIDRDKISKTLLLNKNQKALLSQCVGFPK
jgi:D-serine deaminase-like pyridoxal phosphate-dependent protein